jgi:hypothetical protein
MNAKLPLTHSAARGLNFPARGTSHQYLVELLERSASDSLERSIYCGLKDKIGGKIKGLFTAMSI